MLEAAQQCGRNHLPTLVVGETLLQALDIESEALKLVAYENEAGQTIKDVLKTLHSDKSVTDVLICIGPEGAIKRRKSMLL